MVYVAVCKLINDTKINSILSDNQISDLCNDIICILLKEHRAISFMSEN